MNSVNDPTAAAVVKVITEGPQGPAGPAGDPGSSAYQIAVAAGFTGTQSQWLASLVGPQGATGPAGQPGVDGSPGADGADGSNAYQLAVAAGFTGTEAEWLTSLTGPQGPQGAGLALQGTVPTIGDLPASSTVGYGYIVATTGDLHVWSGSSWVNAGPLQGPAGPPGADGSPGADGADGASAYQVAVAAGFTGTEAEWLATLVGPAGADGTDGSPGADGASAYEVAVAAGFVGTEAQWLASLIGPAGADGAPGVDGADGSPGADGASAYQIAIASGFTGTEAEWLASLVGPAGADGADGLPGADGSPGADGADGASAYQLAVAGGFVGTEAEWLASLVGPAGPAGADGAPGADGADGAPGVGVPPGGTTGQALIKNSGTDYDAGWTDLVGGSATPAGNAGELQINDGQSPAGLGAVTGLKWDSVNSELDVPGDINLDDGGTFATTLQLITPTANRTISFPDATGTVALVGGFSGQLIYNNAGAYAGGPLYSSTTGTLGYPIGGTITQATSKSTGVTLNGASGRITLNAAALNADTTVSFTLTNSSITANDLLVLNHVSGGTAGAYLLNAQAAAGSASINVRNITAGSLSEAIVIGFAVLKA